jgi:hypothetical protein
LKKQNITQENKLVKSLINLVKIKKIQVLYEAIDNMQTYNGRSRFLCIAMAMGYDNDEGLSDTYTK